MYKPGGTIKDALDRIIANEYVLPAIQREFVWRSEQICRLFDSVMQGYPFGDFLFWRIEPKNSADYSYYRFVQHYHQKDNPHCANHGTLPNQPITAVLDGQQRLTAFNIGLRGSMAVKVPYKWWNSPDAFPTKVLALELLNTYERDEEGNCYRFDFVEEKQIGRQGDLLWFKVSEILNMSTGPDMLDWLMDKGLENEQLTEAYRVLDRLYRVIHNEPTISYYEETIQDIEHVLRIFIRCNSGGTTLSYSDLLLSIATSQWNNLDARKEVHQLVDELNSVGQGLGLTKDFVLKAGLMLSDIANVGFQVRNFTQRNMVVLEENWQRIRNALIETVQLVTGFGFNSNNIRAASALLPIAYYLYQIDSPTDFDYSSKYRKEREQIRGWLVRSILKASGIWGSGLDTLLTDLRECLRENSGEQFPVSDLRRTMAQKAKSLEFSNEEIEDLADIEISDRRIFALLSLLFSFVDFRNSQFHIDHIFPKSRFTQYQLRKSEISEEQIEHYSDCVNRIGNLQLLEGNANQEKRAQLPAVWIDERYNNPIHRQHYCDQHLLGEVPREIKGFPEFYEARRKRLHHRIAKLVNSE